VFVILHLYVIYPFLPLELVNQAAEQRQQQPNDARQRLNLEQPGQRLELVTRRNEHGELGAR